MKLLDNLFSGIGRAFTADLKQGAEGALEHAQKSLDRVSYVAGAAVLLAVALGALSLYLALKH